MNEDNRAPFDFSDDYCFLLEDIQNSFGVSFDVGELGNLVTVGELYSLLLAKLGERPKGEELSSVALRLLSQSLQPLSPGTAVRIGEGRLLTELLPWARRRSLWERLQADCRLVLPPLERPRWVRRSIFPVSLLAAVWGAVMELWPATGPVLQRIAGGFVIWLAVTVGLVYLTQPLRGQFPPGLVTLGDLGRFVVRFNFGKLASDGGGFDPAQAWSVYRQCVALSCSHSVVAIQPEMRFVEDLGY